MTPKQVLDNFFAELNKTIHEVYFPYYNSDKIEIVGFGLLTKKEQKYEIIGPGNSYQHFKWATKEYRDESCAVFKMIRFLEKYTIDAKKIYWRYKPKVESNINFDSQYKVYRAYVRFSRWPEIK